MPVVLYFMTLGKEHYCEGIFNPVKQWNQGLNAKGDYMAK
jgi:hypothetical protein